MIVAVIYNFAPLDTSNLLSLENAKRNRKGVQLMPQISIDFYGAATPDHKDADLDNILKFIGDLEPNQRLIDHGREYADYIEITNISHGQIFGGAAKVRKTGIPNRFNLKTFQRRALDISREEGLEEVAYFIYDSGLKTLALQRHRLFRSGAWQRLVCRLAETSFTLEPRCARTNGIVLREWIELRAWNWP